MSLPDAPLASMPPSDATGFCQALVVSSFIEKDSCPVQKRTSIDRTPGDDHNDKDASISSPTPSWEEIVELLK